MKRFTMTMMLVLFAVPCFAQLAPWPVQKEYYGVLGHWRMNDFQLDAGSIVAQYKLNDTAAAWCAGFGTALELDGANDFVDTGQTFQTTFRGDFSVSLWIQPHDGQPATEQCLIGGDAAEARGGLSGDGFAVYLETDGRIYVEYCAGGYTVLALTEEAIFKDGEQNWHNVIVALKEVAEGEQGIFIYMDGGLTSLDEDCNGAWSPYAVDFSAYTSSNNIFIGARDHEETADLFFDGRMDNVVIFNKALTTIEVAYIATTSDEDYLDSATTVAGSDKDSRNLTSQTSLYNVANTSGQVGGCFSFDGTNDYLYRADDSTFDFGTTSDFSVSFWAKWTQSAAGRFVCKRNPSGNTRGWWVANLSTGEIRFAFHNGSSGYNITTTNTYRDGQWHHIVCTRDAGVGRKIFVDGVERASGSAESDNLTSDDELYLGCDQAVANLYAGSMDDLIVFDRALTAAEADAIYDRGVQTAYSREMSSPTQDWRYYADIRRAIWSYWIAGGDYGDGYIAPSLVDYQTGWLSGVAWAASHEYCVGDLVTYSNVVYQCIYAHTSSSQFNGGYFEERESTVKDYEIGDLVVQIDNTFWVNKTAMTVPLSGNCDPENDSTNWIRMAAPDRYNHYADGADYHVLKGVNWVHGYSLLPSEMDPYFQTSGGHYANEFIPSNTPSYVTINAAKVEEYYNAILDCVESLMDRGGSTISTNVNSTYTDWYEQYEGVDYDINTDGRIKTLLGAPLKIAHFFEIVANKSGYFKDIIVVWSPKWNY